MEKPPASSQQARVFGSDIATVKDRKPFKENSVSSVLKLNLGTDIGHFRQGREALEQMFTPASNNIARGEAVDLTLGDGRQSRVLVYPNSSEDDRIHQDFEKAQIPQFERVPFFLNPDLTLVSVPNAAYRLDSIVLSEQETTLEGYTGALEIMDRLGFVLGLMKRATGMFPSKFQICEVAFVTGDKNFIKLIPPYNFSETVQAEEIIDAVAKQLDSLDPDHAHKTQTEAFAQALQGSI